MRLFETVTKLCFYGNSLGSNPDISQKYKMGDISKEAPPKIYKKKSNQVETIIISKNDYLSN
jgi:hypothetical protein